MFISWKPFNRVAPNTCRFCIETTNSTSHSFNELWRLSSVAISCQIHMDLSFLKTMLLSTFIPLHDILVTHVAVPDNLVYWNADTAGSFMVKKNTHRVNNLPWLRRSCTHTIHPSMPNCFSNVRWDGKPWPPPQAQIFFCGWVHELDYYRNTPKRYELPSRKDKTKKGSKAGDGDAAHGPGNQTFVFDIFRLWFACVQPLLRASCLKLTTAPSPIFYLFCQPL